MAAPLVKMFPSISEVRNDFQECYQEDTDFEFRKAIFGIFTSLKANRCLLAGKHGSGRTCLLFQCALSCALEGQRVVFITHSRFQSWPLSVQGAPSPDPLLMKQIHILYYQDRPSLVEYLASIHTAPVRPDVLLVDDIDFYVSHPKTQDTGSTIAMLCAYLVDAAAFIDTSRAKNRNNNENSHQCILIASVTMASNGEVALEHVYHSFLPTVFRISGVPGTSEVYQLSLHSNGTVQASSIITYEIKDNIRLLDYTTGDASLSTSQDFTQEERETLLN